MGAGVLSARAAWVSIVIGPTLPIARAGDRQRAGGPVQGRPSGWTPGRPQRGHLALR